jgi:hypothetical protein
MGASWQMMQVPGDKTWNEVTDLFADVQDQDLYENGHSYSGGFGMARGLKRVNQTFDSSRMAERWLQENAQKWEEALAVTVAEGGQPAYWLIGAWCSS